MKQIGKKQSIERLNHLISRIDTLKDKHARSGEFKRWYSDVKKLLKHLFGDESTQVQDFRSLRFSHASKSISTRGDRERRIENVFRDDLEDAREFLHTVVEDLSDHLQAKRD